MANTLGLFPLLAMAFAPIGKKPNGISFSAIVGSQQFLVSSACELEAGSWNKCTKKRPMCTRSLRRLSSNARGSLAALMSGVLGGGFSVSGGLGRKPALPAFSFSFSSFTILIGFLDSLSYVIPLVDVFFHLHQTQDTGHRTRVEVETQGNGNIGNKPGFFACFVSKKQ